jgi:hypothetical protein
MKKIVRNTTIAGLILAGALCIGAFGARAQNSAGNRGLEPVGTNIPVNSVSIPNIPLRIGDVEVQDTGRGTFALRYSISNEGLAPASLVRLTLIRYDANGVPKGGESWTSREYLHAGETRVFLVPLKSSFSPSDRAAVSILNAKIGSDSLDSSISNIVKAANSGLSQTSEPAFPAWSHIAEDGSSLTAPQCASPVVSGASAPLPVSAQDAVQDPPPTPTPTPQPLCDPVTFCNGCANLAQQLCGLGHIATYSCDAGKCICSFTCKTLGQ